MEEQQHGYVKAQILFSSFCRLGVAIRLLEVEDSACQRCEKRYARTLIF